MLAQVQASVYVSLDVDTGMYCIAPGTCLQDLYGQLNILPKSKH